MSTPRLPTPGSDGGVWGSILNDYLKVSHTDTGDLKGGVVGAAQIQDDAITKTKLSTSVQQSLDNADAAASGTLADDSVSTVKIQDNAVTNDKLDSPTRAQLTSIDDKYEKPGSGIPKADLASGVQTSLDKADSAIQVAPPDADGSNKGLVRLTGDLGGTASSPTVPGLSTKVNTSRTVNGHSLSADVTVSKSDVGLGNVDNTSDVDKPISTAVQAALYSTQTLSDGATVNWNAASGAFAQLTLGGSRSLANPTNLVNGASYILLVKQDGTGSRTLTFGSAYKVPGGLDPTLSTAANAVDIIAFLSDGTSLYGSFQGNFS